MKQETEYNYYRDQLSKVDLKSQFAPKIQIIGGEVGKTKWMDINYESAPIIIEFLQKVMRNSTPSYFK